MQHDPIIAAVAKNQPEMVAFLRKIVDMDSPTEDKALTDLVGDVLQKKAESIGMRATRDPQAKYGDNRICRLKAPNGTKVEQRILLVGHYDTVYAAGTTRTRPFTIRGDRALGPGAFDMKGGLTIGLFALEALKSVMSPLPLDVTFIFNSDEEVGSPESRKVILEETKKHDLALVLEPGRPGPAITIRRKGVGIFRIEVEGTEAHAGAEPEKGVNSIVELAHKVLAVQALNDWPAGTTVTPGVIEGGTKPYVVPGHAALSIDCRIATAQEQERIEKGLQQITEKAWVEGTRARLSGSFHRPPMEASAEAMTYVELMRKIAGDVGFPLQTAMTGGASDGNLTSAAGTPTIDGLGVHGARAHSPEEYIELPSLEGKCRVLACFLGALARGEGASA